MRLVLAGGGFGWLLGLSLWGAAVDEPRFDVVKLKNGTQLSGLVEKESATQVTFHQVFALPGGRYLSFPTELELDVVAQIERAPPVPRRQAEQLVAAAVKRQDDEQQRLKMLALQRAALPGSSVPAWEYRGKFFHLLTDFHEPLARQVALQLEDFFGLVAGKLPPRVKDIPPLKVLLYSRSADYHGWLRSQKRSAVGTTCYLPALDTLAAWSEVDRLLVEGQKVVEYHRKRLQEVEEHLTKLRRHFAGKPPGGGLLQAHAIRAQIRDFDAENEANRWQQIGSLLRPLYHEVLTAYLSRWVYPGDLLPRWLEEGLAQSAEATAGHGGTLTWGRLDAVRLRAAQGALQEGELWSVERLLSAPAETFNVNDRDPVRSQDRTQLSAWAFAYYLCFERKSFGTPALDEFIQSARTGDWRPALAQLTKQPLPELEKSFQTWLRTAKGE